MSYDSIMKETGKISKTATGSYQIILPIEFARILGFQHGDTLVFDHLMLVLL